jgi:hypothetical protein
MEKYYKGKKENGDWERFISNDPEEATPEASGYIEVEEITKEEFDNLN